MINEIINTCFATASAVRPIAYYTHLVSAGILLMIGFFLLFRNKQNVLTKPFFFLSFIFGLWLIFDVFLWTSNNYHIVNMFWSLTDYTAVIGFLSAIYFFYAFCFGERMGKKSGSVLILLSIIPFLITLFGHSVIGFNQPVCESLENDLLTKYKIAMEVLSILAIIFMAHKALKQKLVVSKGSVITIGISLLFFLGIFSSTGYFASITGIYEIELYGLFALPLFLMIVVFSMVRFDLFELRARSQQLIAYSLVILIGSKIFFADGVTDFILNIITLILSIAFVYTLTKSINKEDAARKKIESLNKELEITNTRLRELDMQKTEFISLASHQLRGPLTAIKGYASMVLEGDFGPISSQIKEALETIFKSTQALVVIVGDYLDITRIESGKMKYDFTDFNIKDLVSSLITELAPSIQMSNLTVNFKFDESLDYMVRADQGKVKQVISNIIDNASKYTKEGGISVKIERNKQDDVLISVKDTGVGIAKDVLPRLFEKFARAPDASRANIMGTGLGLYVARKIIEAHRGKIWVESEGKGKGSTFFIQLEPIHSTVKKHFDFKEAVMGKMFPEATE